MNTYQYAGFWIRFAAFLIDFVIINLSVVVLALIFMFFGSFGIILQFDGLIFFVSWFAWPIYEAIMSEKAGATFGKMALGLEIQGEDNSELTLMQCWVRPFAKYLSWIVLTIGYLMAAFTPKKQSLHDMICKTVVVNRKKPIAVPSKKSQSLLLLKK